MKKRKKLNIVLITHTFFPETSSGAEQQTLKLANALDKKIFNPIILAPKLNKKTQNKNIINTIPVERFKVKYAPNLGGKYFISFISWSLQLFIWFLFNYKNVDIIQGIHAKLHIIPMVLISKFFKIPIIVKLGRGGPKYFDLDAVKNKKIFGNFFCNLLKKNINAWIANSDMIIEDLKRYKIDKSKIFKIYNGTAINKFKIRRYKKFKTFIVVGRLEEEKCCEEIIDVFSKLPYKVNAKLIFLGNGSLKKKLLSKTKFLKQGYRIKFLGEKKNILKFFLKADFYLSASKSEGMSNALLEAMSVGLPSISSRTSGVNEIIKDNINGYSFNIGEYDKLYKKIITACNISRKKYNFMSKNSLKTINKKFSMAIITNKYQKLYKKTYSEFN